MADLVGTCPKDFWLEWIAEGDAAGDPATGEEWGWYTRDSLALQAKPGDRFYIVAHGLLRGWAPVTRVHDGGESFIICRHAGAVACTIATPIPGFRGLRTRWWGRGVELPFPDWKSAGLPERKRKRAAPAPLLECSVCKGSGFSGRGSGYDDVCGECGGQKYLPVTNGDRGSAA